MINIVVHLPISTDIIRLNVLICEENGHPHHCFEIGKIESALHSAFYPGTPPFAHGGIARLAGALCFYLLKAHAFMDGNKRTAMITAIAFMNKHGWDLQYPYDELQDTNALFDIIDGCAANKFTKEQIVEWFDVHKVILESE